MQIDLTLEELEQVLDLLEDVRAPLDLRQKFEDAIEQAQELEALDLNDCGDACKL